jgi:hypothetical protein
LTNPEVEDAADPEVQQKEPRLEAAAHDLRAVAIGAADKFLGCFGRRFRAAAHPASEAELTKSLRAESRNEFRFEFHYDLALP